MVNTVLYDKKTILYNLFANNSTNNQLKFPHFFIFYDFKVDFTKESSFVFILIACEI
jgi:hypothetical protein